MPTEVTRRVATVRKGAPDNDRGTTSSRRHEIVDETTERVLETVGHTDDHGRGRFRTFVVRLGIVGIVGLLGALAALTLNLFEFIDRTPCDFLWKDSCPIEREIEVTNYNGVDEWVELTNTGADPVDLARWEVRDRAGHTYQFMDFVLDPGARVVVHTGHGDDTPTDVYWDRDDHVWNNGTELVVVVDADGQEVDSYVS